MHRCDDVVFHYFLSTPAYRMKGRDAQSPHELCQRPQNQHQKCGSVCTDGDATLPVMDGHKHCCDSSVILSKNKEELNRVKKKLTSVKDRLEQAEVLLKEFNEADDCRTEHLNDMSMKACEFQSDNTKVAL